MLNVTTVWATLVYADTVVQHKRTFNSIAILVCKDVYREILS